MHISDGILPVSITVAGFAIAAAATALTIRNVDPEEIPKISVITSAFFVASLVHFPVGPSSVHLILNGLAGIVLGKRAFAAILLGIVLQAYLFGHGGLSVIGVNTVMMGTGALCAYAIWLTRRRVKLPEHLSFGGRQFRIPSRDVLFGAIAGAVGIFVSGIILSLALISTGEAFFTNAKLILGIHIPLMLIEGAVSGACVGFLMRVKPSVLCDYQPGDGLVPSKH